MGFKISKFPYKSHLEENHIVQSNTEAFIITVHVQCKVHHQTETHSSCGLFPFMDICESIGHVNISSATFLMGSSLTVIQQG